MVRENNKKAVLVKPQSRALAICLCAGIVWIIFFIFYSNQDKNIHMLILKCFMAISALFGFQMRPLLMQEDYYELSLF